LFEQAALLAGVEPLQRTTQLVDMPGRDRPSRERVAQVRSALGDLGALQRACRITATGSQGCRQVGVRSQGDGGQGGGADQALGVQHRAQV
jgi:hypothetical protein